MSKSAYKDFEYDEFDITDDYIRDLFLTDKYFPCNFTRFNYNKTLAKYFIQEIEGKFSKAIKEYICNRFDYTNDFVTALTRILFYPDEHPTCVTCGKKLELNLKVLTTTHCSYKCAQNDSNVKLARIESYKETYWTNRDEIVAKKIENSLANWGVEYPSQSDVIKERKRNTYLERFGAESWWKSQSCIEHNKEIAEQITCKRFETYKNNHRKFSKSEQYVYEQIKSIYPSVIRQYYDDRYPYHCDFYIPEHDLFIEYQGSEMHGNHPYDENDISDKEKVEELRRKSVERKRITGKNISRYDVMIHTWTIRDVEKRKFAKNLNYLELWSLENILEKIAHKIASDV